MKRNASILKMPDKEHTIPILSKENKTYIKQQAKIAREYLKTYTEYRMKIADISQEVNKKINGNIKPNMPESKFVYTLFAKEIGIEYRALDNWIYIKNNVWDMLPEESLTGLSYNNLYEISRLVKLQGLSPSQALDEFEKQKERPSIQRINLLLRYSSNLLTSCRKYRSRTKNPDIEIVLDRLKECQYLLTKKSK